jgi:hypothetical protein
LRGCPSVCTTLCSWLAVAPLVGDRHETDVSILGRYGMSGNGKRTKPQWGAAKTAPRTPTLLSGNSESLYREHLFIVVPVIRVSLFQGTPSRSTITTQRKAMR